MRLVMFRGVWGAYERVAGRPRRTSLGTTDREVAARRLIDLEQGRRRKATTVEEMWAVYLEERGSRLASKETLRFAWKLLEPAFGHLRPDQITRALTRSYAAKERKRGISDGKIRRDLATLSAIIHYSDKHSPAVIEMPPSPPPHSRHLTREEYRGLRETAKKTPHLYLVVLLAYRTGGRTSAILELPWDRIDFAHPAGLRRTAGQGSCHCPDDRGHRGDTEGGEEGRPDRLRDRVRWQAGRQHQERPLEERQHEPAYLGRHRMFFGIQRRSTWPRAAFRWRRSRSTSGTAAR